MDLLDDSDAFVVGKALASLPSTTEATAIDRLVGVAKKHPALTTHVIEKLVQSDAPHDKLIPHVRAFAAHADAAVRVAAIDGLSDVAGEDFGDDFVRALGDAEPKVRIAAADAIVSIEARPQRPKADDGSDMTHEVIPAHGDVNPRPQSLTQRIISSLFGPPNPPPRKVEEKPQPDAKPAAEQKQRPKPPEPPEDFHTALSPLAQRARRRQVFIALDGEGRAARRKMLASPAPDEQSAAAIAWLRWGNGKRAARPPFNGRCQTRFVSPLQPPSDGSRGSGGSAFMSSY